jgi:hypothetical protein
LGARIINDGTGQAQAAEVVNQVTSWGCRDKVKCASTDTTTSNTGCNKGAVRKLELILGRILIYLACRHHMLEIIPKNIFDKVIEPSSSPDIGTMCRNFKAAWPSIDQHNFRSILDDEELTHILAPEIVDSIVDFCREMLRVSYSSLVGIDRGVPNILVLILFFVSFCRKSRSERTTLIFFL